MKIHFKKTTWEEIKLPSEFTKEDVIEFLESKSVEEAELEYLQYGHQDLLETDEMLDPYENEGMPTIELLDDKGKRIWDNGREEG
jgi:hypothetical protein